MKLAMFLFAAWTSAAFAQSPVDTEESVRRPLCEANEALGSQCHTLTLHGAPVRIAGLWSLGLIDVKDSRCPINVDCVWEGMVTTTFLLNPYAGDAKGEKIVLSLDPRDSAASVWVDKKKGLKIELEGVMPLKIGRPPMPTRYYAQVRVSRISFVGNPPVNCPDIEKPAICSYEDIQVSGLNRCLARAELTTTLNKQGISFEPEAIQCQDVGL